MYKVSTIHPLNPAITISGDWAYRSKELKRLFSQLTDADLLFERGREGELIARMSVRLKKNEEEIISILKMGRLENI